MASAEVWKTEYHVLDEDGDAVEWLEDREGAITQARAIGGSAMRVVQYHDDRQVIWPTDEDDDDA